MTGFSTPETLDEAILLLAEPGAHALAGGVAFTMALTKGEIEPERIVSLRNLRGELGGVAASSDGTLTLGALTTHRELLEAPEIQAYEPRLPTLFSDVANVRVRAVGTIGGNLAYADPRQDPAPLLCALGAVLALQGPDGGRDLPLEALATGSFRTVLAPGELITHVRLPPRPTEHRCGWSKLQSNSLDDYATVSAAVAYRIQDGTVADPRLFLGAADTHVRPLGAGRHLAGAAVDGTGSVDSAAVRAVADALVGEITPTASHRGSEDYQRHLARVALRRALEDAATGPVPGATREKEAA